MADWLHVSCTCPHWGMNNSRTQKETGHNFVCAHLSAAKDYTWDDMLSTVRKQFP